MWRGRRNAEMGRMKAVRRKASPLGLISSGESAVDVATKLSPAVSACEYSPVATSLPSPSADGVEAPSLGLDGHNTPSSDSNSVPAPLEAWRFPEGKRRCEIGCPCHKCHHSTFSQVVDRQSSWRCYPPRCSCKTCHQRKRSKSTSAAVRRGRRSSCVSEVSPSSSTLPDVDGVWPSGRSWGSVRQRAASECGEESRRHWAPQGRRRNGMRSGGETKEVVYRCTPCAKDVYQWGNVRKHLMSMQHLESVKNYRRMVTGKGDCEREDSMARCSRGQKDQLLAGLDLVQVCGYGEEREPCIASCSSNCGEHVADAEGVVDAGVTVGSTETQEDDGVTVDTGGSRESGAALKGEETLRCDGVASATQGPLLHNRTSHQTTPTVSAKQSTFIRVDYVKKKPARESTQRSPQYECARINGSGYNCAVADVGQLPLPYVNLGQRCDSLKRVRRYADRQTLSVREQPAKKMIRRDYVRKPSQSPAPSPVLPPVGGAAEGGSNKDGPSGPPSSEADESEGALGEPLYLSESGDEDSDDARGESMRNKQVVVLDSARFLNRLVRKLNDGGLSCQSCGCKMDSNSVVSQLYNLKPHSPGGDGGESSGECMDSEECGEEGGGEGWMTEDEGRGEARGKDSTRRRRVVRRPVYLDDYETARVLRLAAADGKRMRMCGGRRDAASMLLMTNCVL